MRVTLENVCKRFNGNRVLRGVDLTLEPGEVVALAGINGAGKSTLLHCMAGLLVPTRGRIQFDGEDFERQRLDLRRRFMFLPDFPQFILADTLLGQLSMLLNVYEKP